MNAFFMDDVPTVQAQRIYKMWARFAQHAWPRNTTFRCLYNTGDPAAPRLGLIGAGNDFLSLK